MVTLDFNNKALIIILKSHKMNFQTFNYHNLIKADYNGISFEHKSLASKSLPMDN